MQAGKLRHQITIEQLGSGLDAQGDENGTWSTFITTWASIEPISGQERNIAQTIDSEVTHKIHIRYQPGVVPKMRVNKDDERYFDIWQVVNVEERDRELILLATEKV